jgi:hypothetical protein
MRKNPPSTTIPQRNASCGSANTVAHRGELACAPKLRPLVLLNMYYTGFVLTALAHESLAGPRCGHLPDEEVDTPIVADLFRRPVIDPWQLACRVRTICHVEPSFHDGSYQGASSAVHLVSLAKPRISRATRGNPNSMREQSRTRRTFDPWISDQRTGTSTVS